MLIAFCLPTFRTEIDSDDDSDEVMDEATDEAMSEAPESAGGSDPGPPSLFHNYSILKATFACQNFEAVSKSIYILNRTGKILRQANLIIWEEMPMVKRVVWKCVDQLLRDIMGIDLPFGGKAFVGLGDFRQVAPGDSWCVRTPWRRSITRFDIRKSTKYYREKTNREQVQCRPPSSG